ncbi:AbiH family protein [Flavisolibacter nicotianae]|uniref:AbiH family protein n=1 Tax=Flavisolibacter nicotianae TaxID=2364882 RepID=UPI000EB1D17D|nr:AbiH family protein [Flavisolibacter nicotianae]
MAHHRLVLIGNGFDLAHGLRTSYKDFVSSHVCYSFDTFSRDGYYSDPLISFEKKSRPVEGELPTPDNLHKVLEFCEANRLVEYPSNFYQRLVKLCDKGWVDIERQYYKIFKALFKNPNLQDKDKAIGKLNADFDQIISLLTTYITRINSTLQHSMRLPIEDSRMSFFRGVRKEEDGPVTFLNFNYTDTLYVHGYANPDEVIHIHGRAADVTNNPIIFGYGDETDPTYQQIEDAGDNAYLEHIKSFGYFKTHNYQNLHRLINAEEYKVYVVGHSCGLSDRVLLSEIFEHDNCRGIEIFFHRRVDGSDNYKEITQEISRHFRPQNKRKMRPLISPYQEGNVIPQNR